MKKTVKTKVPESESKVEVSSKNSHIPDLGEIMEINHAGEVCICEVLKITKELQFSLDVDKRTGRVVNTAEVGILASDGIELKTVPVLELRKIDHISALTVSELIEGWVRKNKGIAHQQERSTIPKQKETLHKTNSASRSGSNLIVLYKNDVEPNGGDSDFTVTDQHTVDSDNQIQIRDIWTSESSREDTNNMLITLIVSCGVWHTVTGSDGKAINVIKYCGNIFGIVEIKDFDISRHGEIAKFKELSFPIKLDFGKIPTFADLDENEKEDYANNLDNSNGIFKLFDHYFVVCGDSIALVPEEALEIH